MTVYRVPDHAMSLVYHLRGQSAAYHSLIAAQVGMLHALVPPEHIDVAVTSQTGNHIVIRSAGGFGDLPLAPGFVDGRLDITAYSRQYHVARQMCLLVRDIVMPVQRHMRGWRANYTQVADAHSFTTPLVGLERDDADVNPAWPFARMAGHLTYRRAAIGATT